MDSTFFEYTVDENEHYHYVLMLDDTHKINHYHIRFYLERNAVLTAELFVQQVSARINIECVLRGQGANVRIVGAYNLHASNIIEIKSLQHHQVADTYSNLMIKGILHNDAYAYYHGTIRVEKEAYHSVASQENKNMLLGEKCRAISIPTLEVLTHDVRCYHGSAMGRWDEQQLLYCAARGIEEKKARRLLVQAFFAGLFTNKEVNDKIMVLYE